MIYQGSEISSLFHVVSYFSILSHATRFIALLFILSAIRRSPLYLDRDNFIFYQKGIALFPTRYLCAVRRGHCLSVRS